LLRDDRCSRKTSCKDYQCNVFGGIGHEISFALASRFRKTLSAPL
jgi:hypothetical protein